MAEKRMRDIGEQVFTGERALFKTAGARIDGCVFNDGESPLKESRDLEISASIFRWKYPLWYCRDVAVRTTAFAEMARAGIWYASNVSLEDCSYEAPKGLRRCTNVRIARTSFPNAAETLWNCSGVALDTVSIRGDYVAMGSSNLYVRGLDLIGNYSFDGVRDAIVEDSRLLSKDAFWNSENVTVRNSFISGEYLGWNSRGLAFENCTIESLQGLCYIDGLALKNCRILNTNLAFEYCTGIDADVASRIDSVKNPVSGTIRAREIGDVIFDDDSVDPAGVRIETGGTEPSKAGGTTPKSAGKGMR